MELLSNANLNRMPEGEIEGGLEGKYKLIEASAF